MEIECTLRMYEHAKGRRIVTQQPPRGAGRSLICSVSAIALLAIPGAPVSVARAQSPAAAPAESCPAVSPPAFEGVIGKTPKESKQAWPVETQVREGTPNVLVWVVDDLGFAQLGSYGGLIDTPNLDRLAAEGLIYSNYHATPVCSPSRAAVLTGRNTHAVHMGAHAMTETGFPGYDARIPLTAPTIARVLQHAGYATAAFGKWDHLPAEHVTNAGPYKY
jgi:hypothetical protein